ncbi:MAG: hypothetical protein FWC77_07115 [Defluviitaleaceae bacterium]|nr:hypothetical protein [Defluviitaleaceae bacterium]
MILYYTRSQKTKVFAEALHDILGLPSYELKSELDTLKNFKFAFRALMSVFTGKECQVSNIPATMPVEIYLCAPIWGGRLAGPAQYFLKHSNLTNTKVNLLITAATPEEKYRVRALEDLSRVNCIQGSGYIFATGKGTPEKDVVTEHIREVMSGEPE